LIGLWGSDPHWRLLLGQEGVPFRVGAADAPGPEAVLVLDEEVGGKAAARVRQAVEAGTCLLTSAKLAAALWPDTTLRRARLQWIAPDGESPLFRNLGIVDLATTGWLMRGANAGRTDSGRPAILVSQRGSGWCIALPFDVGAVLGRHASGPKQFPADTPRFPFDMVSRVSRGDVRRLVANCLRFLLAKKGLPYVHLACAPEGADSIFGFRVDTDFGPVEHLEATRELADRAGMKFSWYINTGAHTEYLPLLAGYARAGQDIQLHCYRHTVYPGFQKNLDNFRRGRDLMAEAGLDPVGVVAPYGEWNRGLDRALAELGFEYSSEFCLSYDDLPSRPVIGTAASRLLQIPVHPICVGRLVAARAGRNQMVGYFRRVIDLQVARQEPCFLYDHPERIAPYQDVLADVLKHGLERCGSATTLSEYARWWQRREEISYSARCAGDELQIEAQPVAGVSLAVERGGRCTRVPVRGAKYKLSDLRWLPLPESAAFAVGDLRARAPNWRVAASARVRGVRKYLQGRRG
jgi:hypothetical protein